MSDKEQSQKIIIDGTEWDVDELSPDERYWASQINDIQVKKAQLQFQAAQLGAASETFTKLLMDSLVDDGS